MAVDGDDWPVPRVLQDGPRVDLRHRGKARRGRAEQLLAATVSCVTVTVYGPAGRRAGVIMAAEPPMPAYTGHGLAVELGSSSGRSGGPVWPVTAIDQVPDGGAAILDGRGRSRAPVSSAAGGRGRRGPAGRTRETRRGKDGGGRAPGSAAVMT